MVTFVVVGGSDGEGYCGDSNGDGDGMVMVIVVVLTVGITDKEFKVFLNAGTFGRVQHFSEVEVMVLRLGWSAKITTNLWN
ncbi:hypothetical protein M0802_005439 [Mischocyttarus mexicanus]|nr:hypothetical protein M0802_005439 [Mischocyttarus mexicanus]